MCWSHQGIVILNNMFTNSLKNVTQIYYWHALKPTLCYPHVHAHIIHPSIIPFFPWLLAWFLITHWKLFLGISLLCSASQGKKYTEGCRGVHFIPFFLLGFGMILKTHWKLFLGVSLLCILRAKYTEGCRVHLVPHFMDYVTQHPLVHRPWGENLTCYNLLWSNLSY